MKNIISAAEEEADLEDEMDDYEKGYFEISRKTHS